MEPAPASAKPSRFRTLLRRIPEITAALVLALLLNRLLFRDRIPILAAATYATPPLILALLAGAAGLASGFQRRWKWTAGLLAATIALLGWHIGISYRSAPAVDGPADLRVACWNISRGARGWDRVGRELAGLDADLIGLVEAGSAAPERLRGHFPGYRIHRYARGIVVLARGEIEPLGQGSLGPSSGYARLRLRRGAESWDVFLADITSDPFGSRAAPLDRLWELVEPLREGPLVVMGDFNTPGSSVHFDRWRENLTHAFDAAGRGFSETWPWPLPVLDIDHVWCGRKVRVLDCRLKGTLASDHRKVVTELSRIE